MLSTKSDAAHLNSIHRGQTHNSNNNIQQLRGPHLAHEQRASLSLLSDKWQQTQPLRRSHNSQRDRSLPTTAPLKPLRGKPHFHGRRRSQLDSQPSDKDYIEPLGANQLSPASALNQHNTRKQQDHSQAIATSHIEAESTNSHIATSLTTLNNQVYYTHLKTSASDATLSVESSIHKLHTHKAGGNNSTSDTKNYVITHTHTPSLIGPNSRHHTHNCNTQTNNQQEFDPTNSTNTTTTTKVVCYRHAPSIDHPEEQQSFRSTSTSSSSNVYRANSDAQEEQEEEQHEEVQQKEDSSNRQGEAQNQSQRLEHIFYLMSNLFQGFGHPLPIALLLGLIILITFVGNVLVCLSVIKVRKLRHPSNYLLISLAISDLCVACVVMPFGLYASINDKWQLGRLLCNVYVVCDVTSCTASILNLCVISIDRYLAITQPLTYCAKRTSRLMLGLIGLVWMCACLISVPPLLISGNEYGTDEDPKCEVSQSLWYQLYATCISFYIPLIVMICLYYNIYTAAKRVIEAEMRATTGLRINQNIGSNQLAATTTPAATLVSLANNSTSKLGNINNDANNNNNNNNDKVLSKQIQGMQGNNQETTNTSQRQQNHLVANRNQQVQRFQQPHYPPPPPQQQHNLPQQDNPKAFITLGVIMGAFSVCWLPFFIIAVLRPFSETVNNLPRFINLSTLWLGYANSLLNPIIYVTFHHDFRNAFKHLLCLRCMTISELVRKEEYQAQYGDTHYQENIRSRGVEVLLNRSHCGP